MAESKSAIIALIDRQCGAIIDTEAVCSFLWFAAIQGVKRKQNLTGLTPKGYFIAAQAIEREVGQIGKAQKATRELSGTIADRCNGIWLGTPESLCCVCDPPIVGRVDQPERAQATRPIE